MSAMDPVPSPVRLSAVAAPGQPEPTPALEQLYRDQRLNRIGAGTDEIMLDVIGRSYGL